MSRVSLLFLADVATTAKTAKCVLRVKVRDAIPSSRCAGPGCPLLLLLRTVRHYHHLPALLCISIMDVLIAYALPHQYNLLLLGAGALHPSSVAPVDSGNYGDRSHCAADFCLEK